MCNTSICLISAAVWDALDERRAEQWHKITFNSPKISLLACVHALRKKGCVFFLTWKELLKTTLLEMLLENVFPLSTAYFQHTLSTLTAKCHISITLKMLMMQKAAHWQMLGGASLSVLNKKLHVEVVQAVWDETLSRVSFLQFSNSQTHEMRLAPAWKWSCGSSGSAYSEGSTINHHFGCHH